MFLNLTDESFMGDPQPENLPVSNKRKEENTGRGQGQSLKLLSQETINIHSSQIE